MRALHVACMPFPSPQGTQGAVHAMLEALARAGEKVDLLVYGAGGPPKPAAYAVHRLPELFFGRSLRSGPSLGKLALDAAMIARLARLARELDAELVVAHNVEAALVAAAAGTPFAYFAHTAMDVELPFYASPRLAPAAAGAGAALDAIACGRALASASISPSLEAHLREKRGAEAPYAPLPWPAPEPMGEGERRAARRALGLGPDETVLLYAGNLDAYQGYEDVLAAAARVAARAPKTRVVFATASASAPLWRAAARRGLAERLVVTGLGDEGARRLAHGAADVALVPRRAPGGLPMKLLDALARGVPVVASRRAAAGLPLGAAALLVDDDDPSAMARGVELALSAERRDALARAGAAYVAREHSADRFVAAHRALLDRARLATRDARPREPRRRAGRGS